MYGHLAVVLAAPLPQSRLRTLVQQRPSLVAFHDRVAAALFSWPPALAATIAAKSPAAPATPRGAE